VRLPLALLTLALAAAAPDQDPYVERFEQLDRNHDGVLSPNEWPDQQGPS